MTGTQREVTGWVGWVAFVGVVLSMLVIGANITYINATPIWSVIVIFIAVFVMCALLVHGDEAKA